MRDGGLARYGFWALPPALVAVIAFELVHAYAGFGWARGAAHAAMGLAMLLAIPRLGLREAYLLMVSCALAVALWTWHPDPWEAGARALDQAVFLMAFMLSIMLIQEAALTSGSVERLGNFLARQPGGRRYVGLYSGTMTMSVLFNLGTLSLLAPLIDRAAAQSPDDPLAQVRERRQLNAVLRGFAWAVVWCPTAVAPLALMALLDGIDRLRWMALGLILALIMLAIGWAEDRWRFRHQTARALGLAVPPRSPMPWRSLWRFLGVCAGLATLTGVFMAIFSVGVPAGLMGAAPILMTAWLIAQGAGRVRTRLPRILSHGMPDTAPAAVTLALSGFVGIAGAALLPAQTLADWVGLDGMPAWVFLWVTTASVLLLSQLALSPIMMAVFFGAVLGALPSLPADPTLTALAVSAGWSVATTGSPFASAVIFLARVTRHSAPRLTYRWNMPFTSVSLIVLAAAYWLMTGGV